MSKIILTDKNNNVDVISVSAESATDYFMMFSQSGQYKSVVLANDDVNVKPKVVDKVKLSKWVKKKDRKVGESEAYCLICGREVVYQVINNRYQFENYCPHCGARMDKE